jgi:methyltransferase
MTLDGQWNMRIMVVPGSQLCRRGPYRWIRHPDHVAVVIEGAALPLACGAYFIAGAFTVANAALLAVRIRVENAAPAMLSDTCDRPPQWER